MTKPRGSSIRSVVIALLLESVLFAQAPPILPPGARPNQAPATVGGIVVQLGTGTPLSDVDVQLHPMRGTPEGMPGRQPGDMQPSGISMHDGKTGRDGRFLFPSVTPGQYQVFAFRNGYLGGEYGQRTPGGRGIPITVVAADTKTDLLIALTPGGSIAGRIYDRNGEPVGKGQVLALKPLYRNGRRTLTIAQAMETNDRGEYRLFNLPPGTYYVIASAVSSLPTFPTAMPMMGPRQLTFPGTYDVATGPTLRNRLVKGTAIEEVFVPVFYPGTLDVATAGALALDAGASLLGIDIPVASGTVRSWHVSGVVLDGRTGQPAADAQVALYPDGPGPMTIVPSARNAANGFDIAGVVPGVYRVIASANNGRLAGGTSVTVGQDHVQNVFVTVMPGVDLAGRFVIEGRPRTGPAPQMELLRVTLQSDSEAVGLPMGLGRGVSFAPPPDADGIFRLDGVGLGEYRVSVRALPPDSYVKSIRMGNTDVLRDGLTLTGPVGNNRLEVVIGLDAGKVDGVAVNDRQEPQINRTVVLVPERALRQRIDLYRNVLTDTAGRFQVIGIPPGDYLLFAFDAIEQGAWQDPSVIASYETRGTSIRIQEGSDEKVQVRVIQ